MELPINPSDDVIERISTIHDGDTAESADSISQTSSQASKSEIDVIKKWIEKKELFISLEREEEAKQTEQALAVLPMKVWNRVLAL
jgi:hypothetical protein